MPEPLHDRGFRAGALRHIERAFAGARIVVFAGEQIERRGAPVDLVHLVADVAVHLVEMQVALEHAGPALQVVPQRFPAVVVGRGRRDQPRHHAGRHLAAVHVAAMQPVHVVIRRDMRRGLQPDDGAEALGMLVREIEHDAAADRAAHHHGLVELQRVGDLEDHPHVVARGELVLLVLVALGRRGFAVPRHVEHDDAIVVGDALVVEQAAILPPVGARGVQAKQRNALARLLDVEPVRPAEQVEVEIAADDGLEARAHRPIAVRRTASLRSPSGLPRGAASTSLM